MSIFRSNIYPQNTIFTCPVCGKRFRSGSPNIQCLVAHPNGSCCHYTDKEIKKEKESPPMLVKVTQEHIDKGRENWYSSLCNWSCHCPISLALKDAFKINTVKSSSVFLFIGEFPDNIIFSVPTPDKVAIFINNFDHGNVVEPFEFELSLEGVQL